MSNQLPGGHRRLLRVALAVWSRATAALRRRGWVDQRLHAVSVWLVEGWPPVAHMVADLDELEVAEAAT